MQSVLEWLGDNFIRLSAANSMPAPVQFDAASCTFLPRSFRSSVMPPDSPSVYCTGLGGRVLLFSSMIIPVFVCCRSWHGLEEERRADASLCYVGTMERVREAQQQGSYYSAHSEPLKCHDNQNRVRLIQPKKYTAIIVYEIEIDNRSKDSQGCGLTR